MNLNHALIVGELAGNTNFPRPPLRTCSNCIRVCTRIRMCGAWIEQEAGGGRKPRFLAHSTLCNIKMEKLEGWRRRKGVVFSYPLERACPHFHQGRPSLLAVARRTRVYIYIYICTQLASNGTTFCPSLSPSRERNTVSQFPPFARVTSALRLAHGAPRSFINERVYLERKTGEGGRRTRASGLRVVKCTVSTWCDARFTRLECKVALDTRARALINN